MARKQSGFDIFSQLIIDLLEFYVYTNLAQIFKICFISEFEIRTSDRTYPLTKKSVFFFFLVGIYYMLLHALWNQKNFDEEKLN